MGKKTPFYTCHLDAGAKMVDFAGWDMPLHYGSQIEEHQKVRQESGMFDVSHMTLLDLAGNEAAAFLRYVLANNVDRISPGAALYSCLLNHQGGVIDDLIVYQLAKDQFRLVTNSATHDKDLQWLKDQLQAFKATLTERHDLCMLAVQGPETFHKILPIFSANDQKIILNLKPFAAAQCGDFFVARTGYTGESGVEMILPTALAPSFWEMLLAAKISPCGLGARDTLRLEAGLNLYGADMDETTSPLISNLSWTVAFEPKDRDFIGKAALLREKQLGVSTKLVGLVLEGQGVLRNHQKVQIPHIGVGEITSGSFSPTLKKGIALARVPMEATNKCLVEMRGKYLPAQIVKLPFVRQGKKTFSEKVTMEHK